MQRYFLVYGAISGAIVIFSTLVGLAIADGNPSFSFSMWLGYLIMLVALSMIFIGIKRYRDQELGGVITFGGATLVGLGIAAVAGAVYVVVWEVYLAATDYAFIENYTASLIDQAKTSGADEAELTALEASMEEMKIQYAQPVYRVLITFLEIFPVGLVITLVSAAILRKSEVLPASA